MAWIAAVIGVASLLAQGITSIYANKKEAKAREKQREQSLARIAGMQQSNEERFNRGYYEDPLATEHAKSVLANARDNYKNMFQNLSANAVKSGETTESQLAKAATAQNSYSGLLRSLYGENTRKKDAERNRFYGRQDSLEIGRAHV